MIDQGIIEIKNFQLKYRIEGQGIPALVIGSSIYYPRTFSEDLRKHLRMIFIDHRGFTPPHTSQEIPTLNDILDDIEHIRKALNLGQVVIIGHSGHGVMALEYAKKFPESITHVVLIATGPNLSEQNTQAANQYFQTLVDPERKALLEQNLKHLPQDIANCPNNRFISFCLRLGARSWYNHNFDASNLWKDVTVNMPIIDHLWGVVFRDIDITKNLETFNKPILLALGLYDFLSPPFYTWHPLTPKFHHLTLRLFKKSGHTPQLEEPDLFNQELLTHLGGSAP